MKRHFKYLRSAGFLLLMIGLALFLPEQLMKLQDRNLLRVKQVEQLKEVTKTNLKLNFADRLKKITQEENIAKITLEDGNNLKKSNLFEVLKKELTSLGTLLQRNDLNQDLKLNNAKVISYVNMLAMEEGAIFWELNFSVKELAAQATLDDQSGKLIQLQLYYDREVETKRGNSVLLAWADYLGASEKRLSGLDSGQASLESFESTEVTLVINQQDVPYLISQTDYELTISLLRGNLEKVITTNN